MFYEADLSYEKINLNNQAIKCLGGKILSTTLNERNLKPAEVLINKLENKQATIGVVGLGYVGLPLAVEKAKAGYKVIGFDVQQSRVDMVNNGVNYLDKDT